MNFDSMYVSKPSVYAVAQVQVSKQPSRPKHISRLRL